MKKLKKIGQITIRQMGKKYIVCVSGDPLVIYNNQTDANIQADKLRKKFGRRPKRKKV